MRESSSKIELQDTLSKESFFSTLKKHIEVMKRSKQVTDPMVFGELKIAKSVYITELEKILEHENDINWLSYIQENFTCLEVYGKDHWGEVLSTGYYEPLVHGSHTPTKEFSEALYKTPNDLIAVDLKLFRGNKKHDGLPELLYGRIKNQTLVPYFDRKSIDHEKVLEGKNLELAWVDPIDAFFIQIQGSAVIDFGNDEKMRVGYANQNGHTYMSIGKKLTHIIPMEKMSLQTLRAYLKTLTPEKQQDVFNLNPSFVFFKKLESDALTYAGMEVSDGRTIATDTEFFPKGALGFFDIEEPQFKTIDDTEPESWKSTPRLVFDQDTGGAIRGGGRVDLYYGKGDLAAQKAGVMKRQGHLYYLVPKTK